MNIIEDNLTTFHQFHWYLFLGESKNSCITSSLLSLIMASMLSLIEYITDSWSLSMKEINLFTIVNWILYISDDDDVF